MSRADGVIGAGLTIAFLAMAWAASQLPYWAQFAPGAGFAPVWFSLAGAAVSAYVAVKGLRTPPPAAKAEAMEGMPTDEAAPTEGAGGRSGLLRVCLALAALVGAMAAVPFTGFLLAISAYLLFVTFAVERLRPIVALAAAGGTIAIIYVLFVWVLHVPFPKSWFGV